MKKPRGVAVNRRGEVVVVEWEGHCVSVFIPMGRRSDHLAHVALVRDSFVVLMKEQLMVRTTF